MELVLLVPHVPAHLVVQRQRVHALKPLGAQRFYLFDQVIVGVVYENGFLVLKVL